MDDRQAVLLLQEMVSIPSYSGEERQLALFLERAVRQFGFESRIDEAGNFVGTIGEGPSTLALVGHMDTVPGAIPVRLEDGSLYGRGSVDAKGPLAAFIAAASRFRALGGGMRVLIIGCVEEEAPSSSGARHVMTRHCPDALVVGEPSGWDAVTVGYKGYLRVNLAVRGEMAHSAHADVTTAEDAVRAWQRIESAVSERNRGRERAFERVQPRLLGLRTESDGLNESTVMELSLRLPLDLDPLDAQSWLAELAGPAELSVLGSIPAWSGTRATELHRAFARAIASRGSRIRYKHKTGTADINLLAGAWGCPSLAYGPGDAALDHRPDEHIEIEEYLRGIGVLTDVLCAQAASLSAHGA